MTSSSCSLSSSPSSTVVTPGVQNGFLRPRVGDGGIQHRRISRQFAQVLTFFLPGRRNTERHRTFIRHHETPERQDQQAGTHQRPDRGGFRECRKVGLGPRDPSPRQTPQALNLTN